ncbi:MAG: hypothetical protein ACI8QS_003437 [Planctomycetota bacterium]|jgi:hypothetical protein
MSLLQAMSTREPRDYIDLEKSRVVRQARALVLALAALPYERVFLASPKSLGRLGDLLPESLRGQAA